MSTIPGVADPKGRELYQAQVEDLLRLQKAAQQMSPILDLDQLIDKLQEPQFEYRSVDNF